VTAAETTDAGRRCADRVRGRAFIGATVALAVLFMGNNLPSALYGLLRAVSGFSSLVQTLLYAMPVVLVVLPGLLVFGTLPDVVGRRVLVVPRIPDAIRRRFGLIAAAELLCPVIGVGVLSLWTRLETAATVAAIVIAAGCVLLIPLVTRRRT
jgi:hypothetical protein